MSNNIKDMLAQAYDTYGEFKSLLQQRRAELLNFAGYKGPLKSNQNWEQVQKQYESAERNLSVIQTSLARPRNALHISEWVVWTTFIIVAFLEMPYNKFAFDNILKSSGLDSYIVSFIVTMLILGLAHLAGKEARHIRSEYKQRILWGKLVASVAIMLVLLFAVGALTIARAHYADVVDNAVASGGGLFGQIAKTVKEIGLWDAFMKSLGNEAALAIFSFNILGIIFAFFISFLSHDSDEDYDRAHAALEAAKKKKNKLDSIYKKGIEKIEERYSKRITAQMQVYATMISKLHAEGVSVEVLREAGLKENIEGEYLSAVEIVEEYKEQLSGNRKEERVNTDSSIQDEEVQERKEEILEDIEEGARKDPTRETREE